MQKVTNVGKTVNEKNGNEKKCHQKKALGKYGTRIKHSPEKCRNFIDIKKKKKTRTTLQFVVYKICNLYDNDKLQNCKINTNELSVGGNVILNRLIFFWKIQNLQLIL